MMAINKRNLLAIAAYAAFFLFCFLLFARWTFPYDRLRDVLVSRVASAKSPSGVSNKLTIGHVGPAWLFGLALTSIKLERATTSPDETPTRLMLDELSLRASPLRFLFGSIGVDYDAAVGQGEIDGSYLGSTKTGAHDIAATLEDVDLAKLGLGSLFGMPMQGTAEGTIDVQLADKPNETHGNVELQIERLRLGDGKAKVKIPGMGGGLTLDPVDAGTTEVKLTIREGVATVEKLQAKGKDLELAGSGSIRLGTTLGLSRIDMTVEVKFDKGYTQRSDRTKVAFELMEGNPMIKRATSEDGTMRFRVSGTLANPRAVPAAPGAKSQP
jgi:type II secretion system protein N